MDNIIINDAKQICKKLNFSELQNKTVLITGASGLIGTYLLATIREINENNRQHINVISVSRNILPEHLNVLSQYKWFKLYIGDLTDIEFCRKLPECEFIIHAAGYGQPAKFMVDPVKTITLNTSTTIELFAKLKRGGKFLFLSTSEIYSGLNNPPYNESQIGITNTTHPRACYIEGKRCGEAICNAYRATGISAYSARLALAYGPGTKKGDGRVINTFIEKAINGEINLLDMGEAKRTYCYVADAVEILWNILLFGCKPIYNVGGNSRITVKELAIKIGKYLKVPVVFPTISSEISGAPDDVYLDMDTVNKEFGKNGYISLDDGLSRTIDYQIKLYK